MQFQKIFFSYSRIDASEFALNLAQDLRNEGVNIWIDQIDIRPGKIWDEEVERALEESDCLLFILSDKSVSSHNVLDEVYYALDESKRVIPVVISNCKIPFRIKRLQHINFIADYQRGLENLLKVLFENKNASVQLTAKNQLSGEEIISAKLVVEDDVIREQNNLKQFPDDKQTENALTAIDNTYKQAVQKSRTKRLVVMFVSLAVLLIVIVLVFRNSLFPPSSKAQFAETDTRTVKMDSPVQKKVDFFKATEGEQWAGKRKIKERSKVIKDATNKVVSEIAADKDSVTQVRKGRREFDVFEKVDVPPTFPGGENAWKFFLIRKLNRNIPYSNSAPPGTYSVILRFIVDWNGNVRNIATLTNYGYGLEAEAIRVLKLSSRWNPGIRNGKVVNAYHDVSIVFEVAER